MAQSPVGAGGSGARGGPPSVKRTPSSLSVASRPLPARPRVGSNGTLFSLSPIQQQQSQALPYTPSRYSSYSQVSVNYQSPFSHTSPSISARSTMTGTTRTGAPGGISKFRRSSTRQHAGKNGHPRMATPPLALTRSADPDQLDLGSLEDPDEVFRLFGVRDVRGLEKRASDAAAAKVAELRTMVGERYRDLLSAADSIVRMRSAADKLVDHFEVVEDVFAGVSHDSYVNALETPSKPTSSRVAKSTTPTDSDVARTLASPPTLSLTIHLLLSLPSLVHSLLDSSQFLPAARLEGVGRVVYRELCNFSYYPNEREDDSDREEEDEEGGPGVLKESFPIIERQWESIASLGAVIVRRATEELKIWDTTPLTTASTLAAILMLENGSIPSSLSLLLSARTQSVSKILEDQNASLNRKQQHQNEVDQVLEKLKEILGVVLKTVESANVIFGVEESDDKMESDDDAEKSGKGLLYELVNSIESPTPSSTMTPPLSLLPSYSLLQRHLPSSILDFTPFLSLTSPTNLLTPTSANSLIQSWLTTETIRVVDGVERWIKNLKGGAKTLAKVRSAVRQSVNDSHGGSELGKELEKSLERRLESVYQKHLTELVERVEPCLSSLLKSLPTSMADTDPSYFLFDLPLAFPPVGVYSTNFSLPTRPTTDPFEAFAEKVSKRVAGRSPLVDKGVMELEAHAREVRSDLADWLEGVKGEGGEKRLKSVYVASAKNTFEAVFEKLERVLEEVVEDTSSSLFLGNFVFALSESKTFAKDLLLGSFAGDQEKVIKGEWEARLKTLQERSLATWRAEAVKAAIEEVDYSVKTHIAASASPLLKLISDQTSATSSQQPTSGVLAALRIMVTAIRHVGPHRTQADHQILKTLMSEFRSQCLALLNSVNLDEVGEEVAVRLAWDSRFLSLFWNHGQEEWRELEETFLGLTSGQTDPTILETSALHHLQRTQTIFAPLLTHTNPPSKPHDKSKLLLWGTAPSGLELRTFASLVPGARLGLLPTR